MGSAVVGAIGAIPPTAPPLLRPPAALLRRRRASRPPPCADMGLRAVVGAIGARTTRLISLVLLRLAHPNSLVLFFSSLFFFLPFLFSIFIDPHFSGLLHVPGISATQASCGKINRIVQNQHLCSPLFVLFYPWNLPGIPSFWAILGSSANGGVTGDSLLTGLSEIYRFVAGLQVTPDP